MLFKANRPGAGSPGDAHLHTLVDLYSPVVVVVQLFVDVPQRLQTEAVGLTHARRHHDETGVFRRRKRKERVRRGLNSTWGKFTQCGQNGN